MTAKLDRYVAALASDPGDRQAFGALEEGYFLAGDWDKLVALYEQRLRDPNLEDPRERAPLHYRLGQILEERRLDLDLAIEQYTKAVQLDSTYRLALRQLRQAHAGRGAWDLVLQIAELEIGTLREPYERAAFFAEMGDVWLSHIHDDGEALTCFQQALAIDPEQKQALAGLARTLHVQGNPEAAAATWERLIGCVRGPDRAVPLVSLAHLLSGPLRQEERAVELYRRALGDDPRNEVAVEALSMVAAAKGQWDLLTDLFERRFRLAAGARRRTAIALEAGSVQLEQIGNLEAARVWFERAQEMSSDDLAVLGAFVELERACDDDDRLAAALDRFVSVARGDTPLRYLLEAASVHTERADDEQALTCLGLAERQAPEDPLVLEALGATYANLLRHDDVATVLERRAALCEDDPDEQSALLIELGYVQVTQLGDVPAAQDAYERAFAVAPARPGLAATLEALYRKTESWTGLLSLLERAAEHGPKAERAEFLCSLGELLEEQFDDVSASASYYEACLDRGPHPRALQGLTRLAERSGDPDAMRRALEREASVTSEPERLAAVCAELAARHEQLDAPETALEWAQRLLATCPDEREPLETVARLQDRLELHDELTRTLMRLEDVLRGPDQASVRRRIAELHERSGDTDTAITWWEATLELDPDDPTALSALDPHYTERSQWEELARVLRRRADQAPREESAAHLDRLAELLDDQLCDLDGAIVVLWRLVGTPDAPQDAVLRLENLLERAGRFEELVQQLLERRRRLDDDSEEAVRLDLRRAHLMLDPLGQFEEAARAYRAVRLSAPENEEATAGLERALRGANDHAGLVRLLEEMAESASAPSRREQLQLERAALLEDALGELEQARQAYTALCEADDTSAEVAEQAGSRLDSLLERCGDWAALRVRLEKAAEAAPDVERIALHERVARLCEDRMEDADGAVEHLEAAGSIDPHRAAPWRALAELYQSLERPAELLRVTCAELETEPDEDRQRVLHARAASLCIDDSRNAEASAHFERLLELDPGRTDATEFLVDRYERGGRFVDVVRLLEGRLDAIRNADGSDLSYGLQTSMRLRIASLRSEELDDLAGAAEVLEAALETDGPEGPATAPLADLYESLGRREPLAALCREAAEVASAPGDRSAWMLRLGAALRETGDEAGAIDAFLDVLDARPGDDTATDALHALYRRGGHAAELVELLEQGLPALAPAEQEPVRMELAQLLEEQLHRPEDALTQLSAVLERDADHDAAFRHALDLAKRLQRHDQEIGLIETGLARDLQEEERIALLERRADLLSGPLESPEAGASAYRELIALAPRRVSARRSLRETLEKLGRWTAVLDCLYVDAESAAPDERAEIYERAAEIASVQVGQDAALPWLERLRAIRPQDPLIIARIADVHRLAGRFESVLRALEDELEITSDGDHARDLHVGRARILERDMDAPGRAIAALEAARGLAPRDPEVLEKLDELYGLTGRGRERAEVIELRLDGTSSEARLPLHLTAAELYAESLAEPERAIPHLLHAVALTGAHTGEPGSGPLSTAAARRALLADLAGALRAAGQTEAWARAAGSELAAVLRELQDRPASDEDDPRLERRNQLHLDLARAHSDRLANPAAALLHLRALMAFAAEAGLTGLEPGDEDAIESRLLDLLRVEGNWVELEERLARRVARGDAEAGEWLELARLRDERLHAPSAARDAYAQSLTLCATSLPAIRGLRDISERLGDWSQNAHALELERDLPAPAAGSDGRAERGALSRRLGEIAWRRLRDPERAIAAYDDALEVDAEDLQALRALQQLHESRGADSEAANLYEREARALGAEEPERRLVAWLAAAGHRDRNGEDSAALEALEQAAEIDRLAPEQLHLQATLYARTGDADRHAVAFAQWCDDPASTAACRDHLTLADALISLGRPQDALARCERASEVDPEDPDAWARKAELLETASQTSQAADAWEQAGQLRTGPEAAEHLRRAAHLVEESESQTCARRLRVAAERDPGSARVFADLARVALALESFEEAERSATRGLDLSAAAAGDAALSDELARDTAMVGGRAARERERLESAVLFYGAALDIDESELEALEAYGELLFERGDLAAARGAFEARLERGPDDRHGERLAMLGSILELAGETDAAMERFREAVGADAQCGPAHAGIARICEKTGRPEEAVRALDAWAEACRRDGDGQGAGARLLRAAELELAGGRLDSARSHLHASLAGSADSPRAWVLLVDLEAEGDRCDEVLRLAPQAFGCEGLAASRDAISRLALLYARALERRGAAELAEEAYATAVRDDARCAEAALARARLLRAAGDWREAADCLRAFCDGHPESEHRDLAEVHYKLARLLAGPLEDMHGAIRCFERAIEIAPDHLRARQPLASLLTVLPERWRQAVTQHIALLDDDPTLVTSIRGLVSIARTRGNEGAVRSGLTLLRAIGAAAPAERSEAADRLPGPIVETPGLGDPTEETARRLVQHAAETLEELLGPQAAAAPDDAPRSFGARRDQALSELGAPGITRFSDEEIGDLLTTLAVLALGDDEEAPETSGALDPALAGGLDQSLGRWTRRKMRRLLESTPLEAIQAIEPTHWRLALHGLAAAVAVDLGQGDLREALQALCGADADENTDLGTCISATPEAAALLRRVVQGWSRELIEA